MGRRGPKSMPSALKLERGTRDHHAPNAEEPELDAPDSLAPPEGMTGVARDTWVRLAEHLTERGVVTAGDMDVFAAYCNIVAQVDAAEKKVGTVGFEDAQKLGYFNALVKLRNQLKQYAAELGLTPASRSAVKSSKPKGDAAAEEKRRRFFGNRDTA